jgi:hypothetical protein
MSDAESEAPSDAERFRDAVKEWVSIHDQLAEIRKAINEKNKRKRKLQEFIVNFMSENDKLLCNLKEGGALEMKPRKSTVALKKDQVESLLQEFLKDESQAKEGASFIFDNREIRYTNVLKRLGASDV